MSVNCLIIVNNVSVSASDNEDVVIIEDVEGTIGLDVSAHFGEFEDDSVHVRNDREKCEYEILFDQRTYDDVLKQKPYLMED